MPVWAVTGNMGGGKTLFAVTKAFQYLNQGRRVVTNVDLFPEKFFGPMRDGSECRLVRLPDQPTVRDFDLLGYGNTSNDESKNGLIVLDEALTLLNSRDFQAAGRKGLIEWFVHARKLGWDVMFVIQSLGALDKQIREMLVEYRVTCRRVDRMKMPIISWLGIRAPLPRIHFASSRYGLAANSPVADFEFFRGNDVFPCYNTKQILRKSSVEGGEEPDETVTAEDWKLIDRSPGVHSVLSPWHLVGRHMDKKALFRAAGRRALLFGLVIGVSATLLGMRGLERLQKKVQELPAAETTWTTGSYLVGDSGVVTVIDDKGKVYESRTSRFDELGVAVLVGGKWYGIRRNG